MKFDYQESVNFKEILRVNFLYDPKYINYLTLFGAHQLVKFHQYKEAIDYLQKALNYDGENIDTRF